MKTLKIIAVWLVALVLFYAAGYGLHVTEQWEARDAWYALPTGLLAVLVFIGSFFTAVVLTVQIEEED